MVRVEAEGARRDCRIPVVFHTPVDVDGQKDESEVIARLRACFFEFACGNGHQIQQIPQERYRLTRIARVW
jgi:hypothetical protein